MRSRSSVPTWCSTRTRASLSGASSAAVSMSSARDVSRSSTRSRRRSRSATTAADRAGVQRADPRRPRPRSRRPDPPGPTPIRSCRGLSHAAPTGPVVRWPGMAEQTTARRHRPRSPGRSPPRAPARAVRRRAGGGRRDPRGGGRSRAAVPTLEIGSVSKGLTGMLLADSRDRGETRDDTRLGDLLPLTGAPASDITLGELATHTSGLPRLADGTRVLRATVELWRHGTNPYGEGLDDLLAATGRTRLRRRRPRYSNLGFMLLGHALAAAAGTTYAALLRDRVTAPLGMAGHDRARHRGRSGTAAAQGCSRRGRPVEPWTGEARRTGGRHPLDGARTSDGSCGRCSTAAPRAPPRSTRSPGSPARCGSAPPGSPSSGAGTTADVAQRRHRRLPQRRRARPRGRRRRGPRQRLRSIGGPGRLRPARGGVRPGG